MIVTPHAKSCFQQAANTGLLKHALPESIGGYGDSFSALAQAYEQFAYQSQDLGTVLALHAHTWGMVFPLYFYGSTEQKQQLPALLSGEIIAGHAITEPECGSATGAMSTLAKTTQTGYVLNGHKRYITNAGIADQITVYAHHEGRLSAFIVHSNDMGVVFTKTPRVNGFASASMGDVILTNCRLPKTRLLGQIGAGAMIMQTALELERAFLFAGVVGLLRYQLEAIIQHVKTRKLGDKSLASLQSIQHRIADMRVRLDTMRLWIRHCAHLKDQGRRITLESAQTKAFAGEAFLQSCLDAVQIYGSLGLTEGHLAAQWVQDALASRLLSGTTEIQKNIIAALCGVAHVG